jgi:hypothetical protein
MSSKTETLLSYSQDIFGNLTVLDQGAIVENTYGKTADLEGNPIWGIVSAQELQPQIMHGRDVFGNNFQTVTSNLSYECKYGIPVAIQVETHTYGTNLFGSPYQQKTLTTNTPGLYTESDKSAYLIMRQDVSTDASSEDLFGRAVITQTLYLRRVHR